MINSTKDNDAVASCSHTKVIKQRQYGAPIVTNDNTPYYMKTDSIGSKVESKVNPLQGSVSSPKKTTNRRKIRDKPVLSTHINASDTDSKVESNSKNITDISKTLEKLNIVVTQKKTDEQKAKKSTLKTDNDLLIKIKRKSNSKSPSKKVSTEIEVEDIVLKHIHSLPKVNTKAYLESRLKIKSRKQSNHDAGLESKENSKKNIKITKRQAAKASTENNANQTKGEKKSVKNKTTKNENRSNTDEEIIKYEEYLSREQVEIGLQNGDLVSGNIRINSKNYKVAYITSPNKTEPDILIESIVDRNRALDGDLVIVKYKKKEEWPSDSQKKGTVVFIMEKVHTRTTVGVLKLMLDKNKEYALLHPRDNKFPRIKIPFTDWPSLFYDNADKYGECLFVAKIKEWPTSKYAVGNLIENIGMSDNIKTETIAILRRKGIKTTPYSDDMRQYYPSSGIIPEEEYKYRLDLRKDCIFTIDPLTARDLDDAVSCKELPNGNLEIGVHIADVSFYLKEKTDLDKLVAERATSTYMVESVYHMLPEELCMFCSLLPGEDKLAFSVFWEMTKEGKIISHKFARTVINSCSQFAYEHAQMIIEKPQEEFCTEKFPKIYNGYSLQHLCKVINYLQKVAINLRASRFQNGALTLVQPKLIFKIDPASCEPLAYSVYENKESHRLIEEFMLLANMTVAAQLKEDFPDIAFLRYHPPPSEKMVEDLQKLLEKVGIHIDASSAGNLQKTILSYAGDDVSSKARIMVLTCLWTKTMTRAAYICSSKEVNPKQDYWHYALNIPLYTHFTSPIRRYADIMVHRLLAGSLGYTEKPTWNPGEVAKIANNCNLKKYDAKRAGEDSIELYLTHFVDKHQPLMELAVVMTVRRSTFDVLIISNGITSNIYLNQLPKKATYKVFSETGELLLDSVQQNKKKKEEIEEDVKNLEEKENKQNNNNDLNTIVISWPSRDPKKQGIEQIISMFSIIRVQLIKSKKKRKIEALLVKPHKSNGETL